MAAKLRDGQALDEWERTAAAEELERAAGLAKVGQRKGRRPSPIAAFRDHYVFGAVTSWLKQHPRAALSEDGVFSSVAEMFSVPSLRLTPAIVRKAYYAELKRRRLRDISGKT